MSKYDKASLVHIPSGYKSGTLYNVLPNNADGDFDYSGGTNGTRVDKNGLIEEISANTPRLDYPLLDGVVQDNPTLLLEPSRQNVLQRSEEFENSYWINNGVTITANQTISPDGSQNADLLTGVSGGFGVVRFSTWTSTNKVASCFAKKGSTSLFKISNASVGYAGVTFNLENGTITNEDSGFEGEIENYGNGWFRCTAIDTSARSGTFSLGVTAAGESVYIWGAQLEAGSYPTSYIPTSGSSVTRSADICNGAGTANDFNDSEGVLYANIAALTDDNSDRKIAIVEGATQNQVSIGYSISTKKIRAITYDGAVKGETFTNACNVLNFNKIAYKYKDADNQLWVNGFLLDTSNNTNILDGVTLDNLGFDANASDFYGNTKEVIVFNEALSDIELETLTSYRSFNEMATEQLYTIK